MRSYPLSKVYQNRGAVYGIAYFTGHKYGRTRHREIEMLDVIFQSKDRAEAHANKIAKEFMWPPFVVQLNLA